MNRMRLNPKTNGFGGLTGHLMFTAIAMCLLYPASQAQEGRPMGPPGDGFHRPWDGGTGGFGFGHHEGKVVTGEPYTAQAVTKMTETLADGSHITRTINATIARDSEGRTMRSQVFSGFPGAPSTENGGTIVTIFDPVARQRIEYNTANKTAKVVVLPAAAAESGRPRQERGARAANSGIDVQTNSLGTQTISGVSVTGTQTTRTIPAGAIGNDKPLQITEEQWYSPDLQMVVQSTRTDPRFGQTTYSLSNLRRTEPSASLFQVPAGFQTKTIQMPAHSAQQ
jgi:hypothetical protein